MAVADASVAAVQFRELERARKWAVFMPLKRPTGVALAERGRERTGYAFRDLR